MDTAADRQLPVPPVRKQRPWLIPVVAGVVLVVVVIGAAALSWSRAAGPSGPRTTIVLSAHTPAGDRPGEAPLAAAAELLTIRLDAAGFEYFEVSTTATGLVVTVAGMYSAEDFRRLIAPAELRFRKVLAVTPDLSAGGPPPTDFKPSPPPTLEGVRAKLGDAYRIAADIDVAAFARTGVAEADPALERFEDLTPTEVALLPYSIQFVVPQITCEALNLRPAGSTIDPAQRAVACDTSGSKYLLDIATVLGTDLSDAQASIDDAGIWIVDVSFSDSGSDRWEALTRQAFDNSGDPWTLGPGAAGIPSNPQCLATQPDSSGRGDVCTVAIALDNQIISAPAVQAVLNTQTRIAGQFDGDDARLLASQLKYGALPLVLKLDTVVWYE